MNYIVYEKKDQIGLLKFNNPKSLNALSTEVFLELKSLLFELYADKTLRCLIMTGEGKAFIAGADIKEMQNMTPVQAKEFSVLGNMVFKMLDYLPFPVIAAVNGFALGGGLEAALSADFIYASKTAKFGLPELSLGLIPGFGGCKRLSDRIGLPLAKELLFSARMINSEEALRIKLVNKVTEPEELLSSVQSVAEEIIKVSPNAVKESKELLNKCSDSNWDTAIAIENNKFGLIFSHSNSKSGMTAFIEKTKPNWEI